MKTFPIVSGLILLSFMIHAQTGREEQYYSMAQQLVEESNFEGAIYYYNKAIEENPEISLYYDNRGYAKYNINDLQGALVDYQTVLRMIPDEPLYFYMLGNIYQQLDSLQKAVTFYNTAINLSSEQDYHYLLNRGNAYYKLGNYQKAIADYDICLEIEPQKPAAYNNRGISHYQLKDTLMACSDWKKAFESGILSMGDYIRRYCREYLDFSEIKVPTNPESGGNDLVLPKFNGQSFQNFRTFVAQNLRYPQSAAKSGKGGVVLLRFAISPEGEIINPRVVMSIHELLDEEAIRVIKESEGMWEPARSNVTPIQYELVFPIKFIVKMGNQLVDPETYLIEARDSYRNSNYEQAITKANKYLESAPTNTEVLGIRANAKEQLGDTQGAESDRDLVKVINSSWNQERNRNKDADNRYDLIDEQSGTNYLPSFPGGRFSGKKEVLIYFDSIWQITDLDNARYYRVGEWDGDYNYYTGEFTDFTVDDRIMTRGRYLRKNFNDTLITYYPDQGIKFLGRFSDGIPDGTWRFFFPDGRVEKTISFDEGQFVIQEYFDINGDTVVYDGTGLWSMDINSWDSNIIISITGRFEDGRREGKWEILDNGKKVVREYYKNGQFRRGTFYFASGTSPTIEPTVTHWIFLPFYLNQVHSKVVDPRIDLIIYPFIR